MGEADPERWLTRQLSSAPPGTSTTYRAAVRWLLRYQGIDPDSLDLPRGRRPVRQLREPLTREELTAYQQAVAELADPVRAILALLPRTGLRISEVANRLLFDVRTRRGRRGLQFAGKGRHERFVPLTRAAGEELDRYLETRDHPGAWLFPGRGGASWCDQPITPDRVRQVCRSLSPVIGSRLHPHRLRHTWATMADRAGVPVRTIQGVLGHASAKTTMLYLHPDEHDLYRALEAVDDL